MDKSKIYVGNLAYGTTSDALQDKFATFGQIKDVKLITDRETGRSKGFAFITFDASNAADEALSLDGTDLDGRTIRVSIAKEKERSGSRGGFRGDRGGFRDNTRDF